MFSGIGTLGRLKAKFASAIEPPTTQAADGIGRPLSLPSFTPAETRIASAPSPMLSPTDRSDGPLFLASGRCAAIGSERSWSVVSTGIRATANCNRSLATRPEAATWPSIAYTPGTNTLPSGAVSGMFTRAMLSTANISNSESRDLGLVSRRSRRTSPGRPTAISTGNESRQGVTTVSCGARILITAVSRRPWV